MAKTFKIIFSGQLSEKFKNNIKEHLKHFNITERVGGISGRCFILLNKPFDETEIWIEFIGFSRIDGYPFFRIESEEISILDKLRELRFNTLRKDGKLVFIEDKNIKIDIISLIEDNIPRFYGSIKNPSKEIKRIFSQNDPYGEEDWEE